MYLDYAAATPMDPLVFQAMTPYFSEKFYNPSAAYMPAIEVRREYEAAKERIAAQLGAKKDQLVMTAGATESINLAFAAIDGHCVTSVIEHQSVLAAAKVREHTLVAVSAGGRVRVDALRQAIRDDTTLISVGLANNELGTLQPISQIAAMVTEIRLQRKANGNSRPLYLHSDASQAGAYFDVKVHRLGIDMLTLSAAKLYGPKQVGLLWVSNDVEVRPVIVGGGQERGLRSGTENVAGVVGFAEAFDLAASRRSGESKRLAALRDRLQARLLEAFPEAAISGDQKHRLPHFLSIAFPGVDGERLVFALENRGVLVATGSACAANKGTRSHVLTAIGLDDEVVDGSLRISLGKLCDEAMIDAVAVAITEVVQHEYDRKGGRQ